MSEAIPGRMLGALRHRNYRLFLVGQIVSTVGTWMQSVALPWLALELTHNGFLVGLVLAAQFSPVLLLSPFAGEVADRYRKRTVLLVTQTAFVVPPFILFSLTATGHAQYWMVLVVAVFSLFAMNRTTLMPLFADQVLHVGAHGFGFLLASMGLGSLAGALTLAFFPNLAADPRRQLWMAAIWVGALLEFSVSRLFVISLVTLFVAGYCQISFVAAANSRIQTITPDHLRGRVMALYAEALIGVGPLGATQAGALATLLGAPWAMAIGASIAGAVVLLVRLLRPEVFGQPRNTSSTAAAANAGTSHRSART